MEVVFELMERLRSRERLDKVPIPADCFDLIGGTSTGGFVSTTTVPLFFLVLIIQSYCYTSRETPPVRRRCYKSLRGSRRQSLFAQKGKRKRWDIQGV